VVFECEVKQPGCLFVAVGNTGELARVGSRDSMIQQFVSTIRWDSVRLVVVVNVLLAQCLITNV
jgi:hypothetical protein